MTSRGKAAPRGRGTGRIGREGRQRIGGQEVSWQYDPEVAVESRPQELYPALALPHSRPSTSRERAQVEKYRSLRFRIQKGPMYTILGQDSRVGKCAQSHGVRFDPFNDLASYSQSRQPQHRRLPQFNCRKYDLRYFPAELRKIIKPQKTIHATKADALRRRRKTRKLAELQEANDGDEEKPLDEEAMVGKDEEIDNASDLQDASYSDEEGGDYNAETYFDGGAEDVDDVAAEGGDDYD